MKPCVFDTFIHYVVRYNIIICLCAQMDKFALSVSSLQFLYFKFNIIIVLIWINFFFLSRFSVHIIVIVYYHNYTTTRKQENGCVVCDYYYSDSVRLRFVLVLLYTCILPTTLHTKHRNGISVL